MKIVVGIWRVVSFPLIVLAMVLGWYGVRNWDAASAQAHPVTAQAMLSSTSDLVFLQDSLRYDLLEPSLRQENFMGYKFPPQALFRSPSLSDSNQARIVIQSDDSLYLGPVIQRFLETNAQGASSLVTKGGTEDAIASAMIQELAVQYKDHLTDTIFGSAYFSGIARRVANTDIAELEGLAPQVWLVQTERLPRLPQVLLSLGISLAIFSVATVMFFVGRAWDRKQDALEDEELQNQKPLV
jgi:hypothetical protein